MTFSNVELNKNRQYIKNRISPLSPLSIKSIKISEDNQLISLKLFNKTKFPIEIKTLVYDGLKYKVKPNTFINSKKDLERPRYKNIDFFIEKENFKTLESSFKRI